MKAVVYKGAKQLAVEQIPTPTPGLEEVLVKVKYCAICGTDVHYVLYDVARPGTVMGHEYCGTIAGVGPGVTRWKVGDRVVGGGGAPPPGKGQNRMADPRYNFRTSAGQGALRTGAYAEYVLLEEWQPVPIPQGVSDEAAALAEPCAVAVRAVRLSELRLGDFVAVLGAGPIGLLCLQAAKAAGARAVIVSEPVAARRQAALALGAAAAIDPTKEDAIARIVELTDGAGPHVVFECAGARATLDQAFTLVRRSGQVVLVAVPWEQQGVLPVDWQAREVKFQTSFGSRTEDWEVALDLLRSGKVTVGPMVAEASFIPLEGVQEAFTALFRPSNQVQMVVKP